MKEFTGKNIIIMTCSTCNSKCKHCYIEYEGDIPSKDLSNMINKLKDKYTISLNGSELLLQKGYLKILESLNQDRVLTNGIVIYNNERLLNEMKNKGIKWVCMSYHFKLHNKVSLINKNIILDNIKKLKQKGFKVEIMTTISKLNYLDIENNILEAIDLGVDCIRFTNLFKEGNIKQLKEDLYLNEENINEFFDLFYKCKEKYKNRILVRRSGTFSRDLRKKNSSFYCPAGIDTVAISPDGLVYPCPFMIKKGFEIGYYEDGKVYINSTYEKDTDTCFLHDTFNKEKIVRKSGV